MAEEDANALRIFERNIVREIYGPVKKQKARE
jgi:hypothetical protein